MSNKYSIEFKNKIVNMIVDNNASTSGTAEKYNVPLKTVEKWITAYKHGELFNVYKSPKKYEISFKKKLCNLIVDNHASTSGTARKYNIPLKTVEKWVTEYKKDKHIFDK